VRVSELIIGGYLGYLLVLSWSCRFRPAAGGW
jgi:hypothetical protein